MQSWAKIKAKLAAADSGEQPEKSEVGEKVCPACSQTFSRNLVVCTNDGTLLIRVNFPSLKLVKQTSASLAQSKYQVRGYIGEGDVTTVFDAFDVESKSTVVIKVVKSQMLREPRRIRRFAKILEETIALKHEGIASVIAVEMTRNGNSSVPQLFMVTERLRGMNLKKILSEFGILAPYVVIETMIQVCATLDYAANIGWLHKDLKPSNIYLSVVDDELRTKICDFGLSERMFQNCEWENRGTKTGSIYGNPAYFCPDLILSGDEHTVSSEIYSLGCIMYHLLKGMPPFEGNNDFATLMQHKDAKPRPFAPELKIPAELESIVLKCLDKKPENRYQSFDVLAKSLNSISTISAE